MRRIVLCLVWTFAALVVAKQAAAQYYSWGSDPASLRWKSIRTPDVRVIYPDTAAGVAHRTLFYINTVRPFIDYGFRHGPLRIPFVLHPENFQSNGLVMWLPKRVEFLTTPGIDSYSMPWIKQLVAHEYRHAVQYNNLNRGVIRAASWVLGQQAPTLGLIFLSLWMIEGDAVMSETEMSSFGRGLQPRFTLEYRALGEELLRQRNPDLWFCGSYRQMVPNHYQLGYQLCSYTYTAYNENIWDKVTWFCARNPYMIVPSTVALKKFYKTGESELYKRTFSDLIAWWNSLPAETDSAEPLNELPAGNYTTYQWPLPLGDSTVLALKTDFDRSTRFVRIDPCTGRERTICRTGSVSTRPALGDGRVWWTEYRRSLLFDQRVNSQLCYMDLRDGRPRTRTGVRNALYPTAAGKTLAWVEYSPDGRYTVVVNREGGDVERMTAPVGAEIHGLAWDDVTVAWYVLVTDDSGMWIGRIDREKIHPITQGAFITLSDLRAENGKLYYGSIASGKDEVHCYDLMGRCAYRLTTSAYGSFSPAPAGGEEVLVTTYDRRGYRVARQKAAYDIPVTPSRLPVNLVNPPRKRWNVVNLDTVAFTPSDSVAIQTDYRARRYRKLPTLIKFHSWLPVAVDPFQLIDEQNLSVNLGVTLLTQNLLSNAEGFVSYGWNRSEGSLVRAVLRYSGLGVHFDVEGNYGGNQMVYSLMQVDPSTGELLQPKIPRLDRYYSVGASATLPLYFQRGYHTRQLSVSAGWNYSNGLVADFEQLRFDDQTGLISNLGEIGFRKGLHKLSFGVGFSDAVRAATRDFVTPWGYTLSANYTLNPADRQFSDLISFYGKIYTPGFFAHNSLTLAVAYQTSIGGYKIPDGQAVLTYKSTQLLPRGMSSSDIRSDHYTAASLNYEFPLCYPEGGIPSVLYFKRIRLNIGGDYAQFRDLGRRSAQTQRLWSVGGDLVFDINLLRQPAASTSSVRISVYKPSNGKVWVGAGLGLPF